MRGGKNQGLGKGRARLAPPRLFHLGYNYKVKKLYQLGANLIWAMHFLILCVALFGHLIPSIYPIYLGTLIGVSLSTIFFGYCILSKWEYILRKKINPEINYDFPYVSYYTRRLTQGYLSTNFLRNLTIFFISSCLLINLYFLVFYK